MTRERNRHPLDDYYIERKKNRRRRQDEKRALRSQPDSFMASHSCLLVASLAQKRISLSTLRCSFCFGWHFFWQLWILWTAPTKFLWLIILKKQCDSLQKLFEHLNFWGFRHENRGHLSMYRKSLRRINQIKTCVFIFFPSKSLGNSHEKLLRSIKIENKIQKQNDRFYRKYD